MTILFVDGFDHYVTADITKKWNASSGATITANGRRGGNSLRWTAAGAGNLVSRTIPAGSSFVIGFALQISAFPSQAAVICRLLDTGSTQCDLRINTDGTLSVTRNGTSVTGGTSVVALQTGSYYYVEWKVTIADSIAENSCKVRLNGADILTVATGQDLKATASVTANQVSLNYAVSLGVINIDFDDFYICDQSGSQNNDFLGDVRIDPIYPNGAGTHQSWTPSTGVDHYAVIDETVPNTTDYLTGGAAGTKETNALQNLSVNGNLLGVQVNNAFSKTDAGVCTVKNLIKSGSSEEYGSVISPSTTYAYGTSIHELDPATGAAWLTAAVNALEVGAEVVS